MPESISIGSFVLGAILILIAIVGGGFKIFGAEISGKIGGIGRFLAFILGTIFVVIGIFFSYFDTFVPLPQEQAIQEHIETEDPVPAPPTTTVEYAPPPESTKLEPATLPANYGCPDFAGASWLSELGIWYGPNEWNGVTYMISYDQYYIYVWNSYYDTVLPYDDPAVYGGRNQWLSLPDSPYTICVDEPGNVYASFTP